MHAVWPKRGQRFGRHEVDSFQHADTLRDSAANAIYTMFRGLNEYAATTPSTEDYHATVTGLKQLVRGGLFDYTKLT